MEKITILVSVKNRERVIGNCVKSLLKTDYPRKEILIIDNASDDKTSEILRSFGEKIKIRRLEGNLPEIFNWALDRIDTKYVVITDSDCVVDKNWAKELLKPFSEEKDIVATAGYCSTPKEASFLQKIIGMELENRFKRFPYYINRAPTMSLCLDIGIAKKVRFDEKFIFSDFEADFGYRLTKYGKMVYNPKAIVWHYHRNTLRSFFIQQKNYAKWSLRLLFKHKKRALADHITTFNMSFQLFVALLLMFSLLLVFLNPVFWYLFTFLFLFLLILYFKNIIEIKPPVFCYPAFLALFFFRAFAWIIGIFEGIIMFSIRLFKKQRNAD